MTITLINVIVKITTLINIIVMTIIDILSTSFCLGLGDGWGMKPSLGRPEVNKCKMQNSIVNLKWYFCYAVASIITLFTSTHVSDVEARRIGFPPASDS